MKRPNLAPGHRVHHLTFVRHVSGGWVCDCDCGERRYFRHAEIHSMGHCGCAYVQPQIEDGEVSLSEVGSAMGITRERVRQIQDQAERRFKRHWALWRLALDTDLETATPSTLWSVVCACRILRAALDARRKAEYNPCPRKTK